MTKEWPLEVEYLIDIEGNGEICTYYTRGHYPIADFIAAVEKKYETKLIKPGVKQKYGRWSMCGEYGRVLQEYNTPGRGRFPITIAHVL